LPPRVWIVRGGREGDYEEPALVTKHALLGWKNLPSLSGATTAKAVRDAIEHAMPDAPPGRVTNYLGQFHAFRNVMRVGDLVVMPRKHAGQVAVGQITGDYQTPGPACEGEYVAGHARPVLWLRPDAPKEALADDLLTALSSRTTVAEIKATDAFARLLALAKTGQDPALTPLAGGTSQADESVPVTAAASADLDQLARDQIAKLVGAVFHGHNLARLVAAVLEADGFRTRVSPPGPDMGIDIVAGRGDLGFEHPWIVVQCKSGSHVTDLPTFHALVGAVTNTKADHGLLVSWGGFTKAVWQQLSMQYFKVRLWDSAALLDAVLRVYDRLPADIRKELPLKRTWTLVLEAEE
jgi:restriction system protein